MGNVNGERKTGRRENCLQLLQEEPNKHKCPENKKKAQNEL